MLSCFSPNFYFGDKLLSRQVEGVDLSEPPSVVPGAAVGAALPSCTVPAEAEVAPAVAGATEGAFGADDAGGAGGAPEALWPS